jgi:hypothetical protein
VTISLDLAAATELQKRLSRGTIFTGVMLYLEGIVVLVLVSENALAIPALLPIGVVIAAQAVLVRHPVQLLIAGKLEARYGGCLWLALVFIALTALGGRGADGPAAAALLSALVVGLTASPAISAVRAARAARARLRAIADPSVLAACMSFDMRSSIARQIRAVGGDRVRWGTPFVVGVAAGAGCLAVLGLLQQALDLNFGAVNGLAAGVTGTWFFYRSRRHAKLRASQLRKRDTRPPVLILREFEDDALATARLNSGGQSFEHFFTAELDRIGPTISVGRPGERLAPLGAARDYLTSPDWKTAVSTMIDDAAVVTFLLGDSDNLLWEFQKTMASGGKPRTLVIVPPLSDDRELRRRWRRFAQASADTIGRVLPADMPRQRVLAFAFAGDDIVMFLGPDRRSARSWYSKVPMDYRLALRLFGCMQQAHSSSGGDVAAFVRANLPIVEVRTAA